MTTQKTHLLLMGAIVIALVGCGSTGQHQSVENSTNDTSPANHSADTGSGGKVSSESHANTSDSGKPPVATPTGNSSNSSNNVSSQPSVPPAVTRIMTYPSVVPNGGYFFGSAAGKQILSVQLGGKTYNVENNNLSINFGDLPRGVTTGDLEVRTKTGNRTIPYTILNSKYATIIALRNSKGVKSVSQIIGEPTSQNVSTNIKAHYEGQAFKINEVGDFSYDINYATKTGEGKITGINGADIILRPAKWTGTTVAATNGVKNFGVNAVGTTFGVNVISKPGTKYFTFNEHTSDGGVYHLYLLGDMDSVGGFVRYRDEYKADIGLAADLKSTKRVNKETGEEIANNHASNDGVANAHNSCH